MVGERILYRVRLVCGRCGFVTNPARGFPAEVWAWYDATGRLPVSVLLECSNCEAEGRKGRVDHFVDYPRPKEGA